MRRKGGVGSAAAPLTRDCLLPPSVAKAPATYTYGAARNAHTHTIKCKSPIFFLYKAISSFLKKKNSTHFSVARGSLIFWRYRSNDDFSLILFPPRSLVFSSLRCSSPSAFEQINCYFPFVSAKARISSLCASNATGFFFFLPTSS